MTTDPREGQDRTMGPSAPARARVHPPAAYATTDGPAPAPRPASWQSYPPNAARTGDQRPSPEGNRPRRSRRRWPVVVLTLLLVLALAAGGYLLVLAQAWSDRAAELDSVARGLGTELARTRADLAESANALATTQEQLAGAQQRITELADTVAQTGDDREVQRQVAAYQARISAAAAAVALAMDDCIEGQEQLIVYLDDEESYDAEQLAEFRTQVTDFCAAATRANDELQRQVQQ